MKEFETIWDMLAEKEKADKSSIARIDGDPYLVIRDGSAVYSARIPDKVVNAILGNAERRVRAWHRFT
jgi:hypothetical protein